MPFSQILLKLRLSIFIGVFVLISMMGVLLRPMPDEQSRVPVVAWIVGDIVWVGTATIEGIPVLSDDEMPFLNSIDVRDDPLLIDVVIALYDGGNQEEIRSNTYRYIDLEASRELFEFFRHDEFYFINHTTVRDIHGDQGTSSRELRIIALNIPKLRQGMDGEEVRSFLREIIFSENANSLQRIVDTQLEALPSPDSEK